MSARPDPSGPGADDIVARARREAPEAFRLAVATRIEREVFERTRWVPVTSVGAGLLYALTVLGTVQGAWLAAWAGVMIAAAAIRMWFNQRLLARDALPSARTIKLTTAGAALSGAFWGCTPWLPLAQPDPVAQLFAAAVVAGVIAGASVSYANAPRIMLAVSLAALPPTMLAMLLRGDAFGFGTSALLVVLGALVVQASRANRRALEVQIAHGVLLERTRSRVQGREDLLRLGADALPELIAYVDAEHRVLFANRRYVERMGMARDKIIGQTLRQLLPTQYDDLRPRLEAALRGEMQDFEFTPRDSGQLGSSYHVRYVPDARGDGGVRGVLAVSFEIGPEQRAREAEARAARRDPRAGLPDAAAFWRRAALEHDALRRIGGAHALLLVDLAGLAPPDGGDDDRGERSAALQHCITLLREMVGDDGVVGRLAADRFAVLLQNCSAERAAERGRALLAALHDPPPGGGGVALSASIGMAQVRAVDLTVDGARERAETARAAAALRGAGTLEQR